MITLWWAKIQGWAIALGGVLLAILTVGIYERQKGKATERAAQTVRDAQANAKAAQQVTNAQEVRNEVESENAKLPDAPPQTVATADPATAAGQLRDDGWVRD